MREGLAAGGGPRMEGGVVVVGTCGGLGWRKKGGLAACVLASMSLARRMASAREVGFRTANSCWISSLRSEIKQFNNEVGDRPSTQLESVSNCN